MKHHVLLWLCLFLFTGCGSESSNPSNDKTIREIIVSPSSSTLGVNKTGQLSSSVTYSDQSSADITREGEWISSNEDVALVEQGKITGLSGGYARIQHRYLGYEATTEITVTVGAEAALHITNNELKMYWKSVFDNESGYQIQRRSLPVINTDIKQKAEYTQWETIKEHAPVTSGFYTEVTLPNVSGEYRLLALFNEAENSQIILSSDNDTSQFLYEQEQVKALEIVLPDTPPPYIKEATFSLSAPVESSMWFIDTQNACTHYSSCDRQSIKLNTAPYSDGAHRLDVQAEITPDTFVALHQEIEIYNPALSGSMRLNSDDADKVYTLLRASSKADALSVDYFIDGEHLETQNSPTPITINGVLYDYHAVWEKVYGEHTINITLEDSDGETLSFQQSIVINNAPTVSLTSPLSGEIISSDNLLITGEVSNDNDEVSTEIKFGDILLGRQLGNGAFQFEYPLTSLPEGNYMVSALSVDEFGASAATSVSLTYQPSMPPLTLIKTLDETEEIIDIRLDRLFSHKDSQWFHVEDLSEPTSTAYTYQYDTKLTQPAINQYGWFVAINADNQGVLQRPDHSLINLREMIDEMPGGTPWTATIKIDGARVLEPGGTYSWDIDNNTWEFVSSPQTSWLVHRASMNERYFCQSAGYNYNYLQIPFDAFIYTFDSGQAPTRLTSNPSFNFLSLCWGNDDNYAVYSTSNTDLPSTSSLYLYHIPSEETYTLTEQVSGTSTYINVDYQDGIAAWQEALGVGIYDTTTQTHHFIDNAHLEKVGHDKVSFTSEGVLTIWQRGNLISPLSTVADQHFLTQDGVYLRSNKLLYQFKVDD